MGLLDNIFKAGGKFPRYVVKNITQSAETLHTVVNESIQLASSAPDLETKKTRLDYAMKKLVELIKLANDYPFLDFRKISSIYDSIREVRNEIKAMELLQKNLSNPEVATSLPESAQVIREQVITGEGNAAICPYCSFRFPVMPQRRELCPSCGNTILVWYSTTENKKKLITEEEAAKLTREISEHIEKYELLNKQDTLQKTEEEVKKTQAELQEKDPTTTLDDTYLFLLNKKINETENTSEKSRLHYLKALMLDGAGKDFNEELYLSKQLELMHLKTHDFVKKVQIITSRDSCSSCKEKSDVILSIDEALKMMPLPHKGCTRPMNGTRGFCRCNYLIVND